VGENRRKQEAEEIEGYLSSIHECAWRGLQSLLYENVAAR
jgi:hypothetical protein